MAQLRGQKPADRPDTKQAIERRLNQTARHLDLPYGVRVSHGKAAEYQARGAVHYHALFRLDGYLDDHPARRSV